MTERERIAEIINMYFGVDAAYFDVDPFQLADHLIENKCRYVESTESEIKPISIQDKDFSFEYGIIVYDYRFSINRAIKDYKEITLNKCIRMGLEFKYYTMAKDKLIPELQIVYKDEDNKLQCVCLDLHEYTFKIMHKGSMMINI